MRPDLPLLKRLKNIAPVRLVVSSFLMVILLGTFLLMLPLSSRTGEPTPLIDSLFTSTSATCVTGLVLFDTWTHWNAFGQFVILMLIQVGGLGLVTFTTGFAVLTRRKLGLRDIWIATENTAGNAIHIYHLVRIIFAFTFACELVGALLLMLRFVPMFGARGIWISIFTSVSAYCNAGFDVLGFFARDSSLMPFAGDPLVSLTVAGLVIVGGMGFIVISDIYNAKVEPLLRRKKTVSLNLHTAIVLVMTAVLLVGGTVFFYLAEFDNTLRGLPPGGKLNAAFFQSAALRTAGFASVPIGSELDITKVFSIAMMFIGASPASTGGGIKTTTAVVLFATVVSVLRGQEETTIRRRRIDKCIVYRSLAIVTVSLFVVLCTTGIILATNGEHFISAIDALFEAVSGFATVGLSTGITPILSSVSKMALSITMFIGRVGPVSLGVAVSMRRVHQTGAVLPEGKIIVG